MKIPSSRDLTVVGDFIRYFGMLFGPFFLIGLIFGFIHKSIFVYGFVNPISYSLGLALIILVIKHDLNDILLLFGLGKENQQALNARYAKSIQEIGYRMGLAEYDAALKKVNAILKEEPDLINALSLKGQILLEGFNRYSEARLCLEKVLTLTEPDDEQHKLADSLIVTAYNLEEG